MTDEQTVSVFAPFLSLTVTIEPGREGETDEIHLHPGGQGFWIARMLRHLGERPLICGPIGGETGFVIRALVDQWGIDISPVAMPGSSPATIQDRRDGERTTFASTKASTLPRHELDDAYGRFLDLALSSRVCVITGQVSEIVPIDTYRRLGHDFASSEVPVVGDFHGEELDAFLDGGGLAVLKVSTEDLEEDGLLDSDDERSVISAIEALTARGAHNVVVSRADEPVLASIGGTFYRASQPPIEPADFRGAGDSMTAGLAAAFSRGLGPIESLRLACGAGAANATRHGLGSASDDLIAKLADRVEVETLTPARR